MAQWRGKHKKNTTEDKYRDTKTPRKKTSPIWGRKRCGSKGLRLSLKGWVGTVQGLITSPVNHYNGLQIDSCHLQCFQQSIQHTTASLTFLNMQLNNVALLQNSMQNYGHIPGVNFFKDPSALDPNYLLSLISYYPPIYV